MIYILKYSRQRECIKEFLCGRTDHPTADTVYMHVRQQYPNISLGTVYRNLTLLSDIGEIIRINVGDGVDHFDACTVPHYHVLCDCCGRIQDIDLPEEANLIDAANKNYNGTISMQYVYFKGTCNDCIKSN